MIIFFNLLDIHAPKTVIFYSKTLKYIIVFL